jgi:uncharacterized membrane protein YeaQ/YmgE (transglycosylase-associated protein family)
MNEIQFPEAVQQWTNDVLVWIGFGTIVGLLAKAIMPGRDPGGAIATVLMGIGGVIIGCGTVSFFNNGQRVTPISPLGFLVATAGAFVILLFYRMLSGYWGIDDGAIGLTRRHSSRRRAIRQPNATIHIDN